MESKRGSQLPTLFQNEVGRLPPEEAQEPVEYLDDEPVSDVHMRVVGKNSLLILGLIPIVLLLGFMVAEQMNLSEKTRTSPLSVNYNVSEEAQDLFSRE